jgi:hypothetical protein
MKKLFKYACLLVLGVVALATNTNAQVYGDYEIPTIRQANYVPLNPVLANTITPTEFVIPFNIPDRNDGFAEIQIGFPFEFNGNEYTKLYVNINGFITFNDPNQTLLPQNQANGLFQNVPSTFANNVIAPFWGNHHLRTLADQPPLNTYLESNIRYYSDPVANTLSIEWVNLNINDPNIQSSVGNFMLILYRATDINVTKQGDIEFAYGQIAGNPYTTLTNVITRNASVGIKGSFGDFVNGLVNNLSPNPLLSRSSTELTNQWTPSGATNNRILFRAKIVDKELSEWGDGDVDFSKSTNGIHRFLPQNRFVTFNDVRLILRAAATGVPLDSVRFRAAYHGDVRHDGRYFYNNLGQRSKITWRDVEETQNLPAQVTSITQVFYEATPLDAAFILNYMSNKVSRLPWIWDTIVEYGKVDNNIASSITTNNFVNNIDGTILVPVRLNGKSNGGVAGEFTVNSDVISVVSNNLSNGTVLVENNGNKIVFAAAGDINSNDILFYVKMNNINNVKFNNVVFNDVNVGNMNVVNNDEVVAVNLTNSPNPFTTNTVISFNLPESGNYTVAIYDVLGNLVNVIADGEFNAGTQSFVWDATDSSNNTVNTGTYIYRLTGNNLQYSGRMIVNK